MTTTTPGSLLFTLVLAAGLAGAAEAQTPAPAPPPGWAGSAGAGLALTSGNSDTSTVNAAYELKRDAGGPLLFKSAGLLVWGKSEGALTSDRLSLDGRIDRRLTERLTLFAQTQYLRDSFKSIDYLVAPTTGVSASLVKNDRTELLADAGLGVVWEKNPGQDLHSDGAVSGGQQFTHKITATTELTQKLAALWKMADFGDALYALGAGIAASITERTQLKVEVLNTHKTRPPAPGVGKNDVATLVSFVYKFD